MRISRMAELVEQLLASGGGGGGGDLDYDNMVEYGVPGRYTPADPTKSAVVLVNGTPGGPGNALSIQLTKSDDSNTFTAAMSNADAAIIISAEVPPGWDYEVFAAGTAELLSSMEFTRK